MSLPIDRDTLWYLGTAQLLVTLYGCKYLLLRYSRTTGTAAVLFALAVAGCVPVTWYLDHDRSEAWLRRRATTIGAPVATLTVAYVSFFYDLARRGACKPVRWCRRLPFEVALVPVWCVVWAHVMLFVLCWVPG